VVCEFNPLRHTYTIINKGRRFKVPSVTRITSIVDKSGPLMAWAINNTLDVCKGAIAPGSEYAETYLEAVWDAAKKSSQITKTEAADRGKRFHELIEASLSQGSSSSPELQEIAGSLSIGSLLTWLERSGAQTMEAIERRVYSRRYRYSGTLDAIAGTEAGLILLDWKTGKSIYPEYRLQTAAYVAAYEEEFPDKKIAGRYLVRIAEDGSIEPHFYPRKTLRKDFAAFLGAKALFDRVQQIEKETRKKK
jgi:hypothetical protein